jgi:hypothetical protein
MAKTFVERRMELAGGKEVIVRFFRPVEQDGGHYHCAYKIIWPDRERAFYGAGEDGVQALLLAMCNAHAELLASPEGKRGALRWCGETDLGLPLAGSLKPEDFK